jgi:exonuclease V gamma subunit
MLHTYTATDHRDLVRAWMHHLRHHPPTHPFDPLTVVVPNMDMARWLQLHLADATGFAGNLHFTLPAAWLRTRFEAANPRVKQLLLDKTHLQWMMFEILSGTNDPTAPWSHVQSWISRIADRASGTSDALAKARWDIATQLADAFDQYIMYRPDWLLAWQGQTIPAEDALGPLPTGPESLWQAALWREVVRRWPDIPNRATLLYQFLADQTRPAPASDETLLLPGSKTFTEIIPSPYSDETTPVSVTASSPGRIYAYGLSTLPLPTMLAMARHARNTEWHWFAQRHPISEESYLRELNSYTSDQNGAFREILVREGVAGTHTDVDPGARPGTHPAARPGTHPAARPANNLRRLQHTALHDTPFQPEASDPAAIRLHACHSARREVEVLYDTILDLFNTTDVRPGDIAIVTPDPDAYRPFIEEIFRGGGIPDGIQPALHVAGARRNPADIGAEVMLGALNLIGTRYKVPEVLDWLEAEPVLGTLTDRSGLRHTLHNWVLRQRIRWGIDARQLIRAGFPLSGRHTWRHGIDRLLLSWLASEGEDIAVGEILTGSTVAGQDTGILLGRLAAVIQALSDLQEASESPATLAEWCTILEQFTSEVFTLSEAGRTYAASVQKALFQLRLTAQMLRLDQPMAFPVVRSPAMPLSAATVLTPRELTLHDLQQFFRNPVKALLRQRPGLSLDEAEVPSESAEPFAFDSLTGWQVRSQVMRNWLETGDMAYDVIETHLRRDGILAEGQAGRRQMRVLVAELQDFIAYFAAQTGDNPRFSVLTADVDVTTASGNTYRIAAMHPYMHAGTAWNFEAGKGGSAIPASKRFRHYLTHLVLNYVQPVQSRTIFRDQKELIYRAMPSELARLRLGNILSVYETGISRPIPFFPGCMLVYLKALRDGMVTQAAHELLLETLSEEPGSHPSEAEMELDNVWVREAYGDVHPLAVETGRHLCGLSDLRQPLKVSDFDTSDLFTLMATRIIDAMKADTETSATQDTSDGANPDVAGGAPSADQAAAAKSTEDPE